MIRYIGSFLLICGLLFVGACFLLPRQGVELWKSDGSPEGTVLVKRFPGMWASYPLINVNGTLFFGASYGNRSGPHLFKSDGTAAGTIFLKEIRPRFVELAIGPRSQAGANGIFFFADTDTENGVELWKSDGTPDGTAMVKDIAPGPAGSYPKDLTEAGGKLFFLVTYEFQYANRIELWRSDGTERGTVLIKDLHELCHGWKPQLIEFRRELVFACGIGLWKSDGTPGRLDLVVETPFGGEILKAGDFLYFTGNQLGRSDGTQEGTYRLASIPDGIKKAFVVNETLFFMTGDSATWMELWKSDGTPEGTARLKRIEAGTQEEFATSTYQAGLNGVLLFDALDEAHGLELWRSDGTPEGTALLKDIHPGAISSWPRYLMSAGGAVFFTAIDEDGGGIWKTDGTEAGTVLVERRWPDSNGMVLFNGEVYWLEFP
jgi:ELWxxDGT repeat protein